MWMSRIADTAPRVVHLVPETGAAGAERQALYLLAELGNRSWRPEVVYFRAGKLHDQYEALGLPVRRVAQRGRLSVDWYRRGRAVRSLYDSPPAILHTWLFEGNVVGAAAASRWPATRVVVTERSGNANRGTLRVLYAGRLIRRRADHAIANSHDGLGFLREIGFKPQAMSLVANGLPAGRVAGALSREQARATLGIPLDSVVVGFVGRAYQTKDLPSLLRAIELVWTRLPHALLVLVGVSVSDLHRLGIQPTERIRALGWLPDATRVMRAFDVLAHSSWAEGHSNAVGEALTLGLPVATTNAGDHAEVVSESGGRVVPIRRSDLLAGAVLDLVEAPPPRERVATIAASRLAMESVVRSTEEIYRELLDRPRSATKSAGSPSGISLVTHAPDRHADRFHGTTGTR